MFDYQTYQIPVKIFISYSRKDQSLVDQFMHQFNALCQAAQGFQIELWRDTDILPGENWRQAIADALARADFGLLFASPHFFASPFIRKYELPHFVSASGQPLISHKRAIPIWLRPMPLELLDTRGLAAQQIFRFNDKSFYETSGAQREQFVTELFSVMYQVMQQRNHVT